MERYLGDLWFFVALTLCRVTISCNVVCLREERDALVAFKNEIYSSLRFRSWNGLNCCAWRGVECSREISHVIKIHLSQVSVNSINLDKDSLTIGTANSIILDKDYPTTGILSPALFKLKYLEHLDLSANFLSGVIPTELSSLHQLKHLDLSFNYFEGQISKHISSLHNLTYLDLSCAGADLNGSILWRLGNLSQLQVIDLATKIYLEDEISYNWYDCGPVYCPSLKWTENVRGLKHLSLQGVELNMTGKQLEAPLSRLHSLHHLNLKDCALSGQIPHALRKLTSLSHLHLGWNEFTSSLPAWLGNLTGLVSIQFDRCDLTGPLPASLSRLPHLKELKLVDNKITGNIGQILLCESWPQLTRFVLWGSNVTGSLPP
ncbi:probably inactive leucine-rich repeat receptor-like protein kinase At3g28040 [Cryptomeria japonica]|uniref:probably inactive leucine-rich repeat receptor-like protein kinase At3g28040 n=1 Tax=Cryptomeria japonica TaxID=3369 RepID=UPI0027DA9941|nr:probably inactive leucine-rich repeat receptor-like protein kinase At3g28040 [Cryptomeria japonica]